MGIMDLFCYSPIDELKREIETQKNKYKLSNEGWSNCIKNNKVLRGTLDLLGKDLNYERSQRIFFEKRIAQLEKNQFNRATYPDWIKKGSAYKGVFYSRGSKKNNTYDKGQKYLEISSYLEDLLAGCTGNEVSVLEAANKILGNVQIKLLYTSDQTQFGISEDWASSRDVLINKQDDCESLAMCVINAFNYYKFKYSKFQDSEMFLGLGVFGRPENSFGHGFPVLYEDVYQSTPNELCWIGEATLNRAESMRKISQLKDLYRVNWGVISWNFEGNLIPTIQWWDKNEKIDSTALETGKEIKLKDIKPKDFNNNYLDKKRAIEEAWA